MNDSTQRFSSRVEAYVKYRPGYPDALMQTLLHKALPGTDPVVADVGSGSGIFTRMLLQQKLEVFAIEPNDNMRQAAEAMLADYPNFTSIDAPAEATTLADKSVDLITAAQAFHWFDNAAAKSEFSRILKPDGRLALIWNKRKISQAFQQAYDTVLQTYAPEYGTVNHMSLGEADIAPFFADGQMEVLHFDNSQQLSFPALLGRLKSSSYCPAEDSPQYPSLVAELAALFEQFAIDAVIDFQYDTELYLGPVAR